jgi:hypothetical protein
MLKDEIKKISILKKVKKKKTIVTNNILRGEAHFENINSFSLENTINYEV